MKTTCKIEIEIDLANDGELLRELQDIIAKHKNPQINRIEEVKPKILEVPESQVKKVQEIKFEKPISKAPKILDAPEPNIKPQIKPKKIMTPVISNPELSSDFKDLNIDPPKSSLSSKLLEKKLHYTLHAMNLIVTYYSKKLPEGFKDKSSNIVKWTLDLMKIDLKKCGTIKDSVKTMSAQQMDYFLETLYSEKTQNHFINSRKEKDKIVFDCEPKTIQELEDYENSENKEHIEEGIIVDYPVEKPAIEPETQAENQAEQNKANTDTVANRNTQDVVNAVHVAVYVAKRKLKMQGVSDKDADLQVNDICNKYGVKSLKIDNPEQLTESEIANLIEIQKELMTV